MSILYYYDYRSISLPSLKIHFMSTLLLFFFFYYIVLSKKIFDCIIKNNKNQEEIVSEGCMKRFKKPKKLLHSVLNCTLKLLPFYEKCSAISILQCVRGKTIYTRYLFKFLLFLTNLNFF